MAASLYSVTELPFRPSDINDLGQVVGEQYLWNNGILTDLTTLPRDDANARPDYANAINNNGAIVGGTAFWFLIAEPSYQTAGLLQP